LPNGESTKTGFSEPDEKPIEYSTLDEPKIMSKLNKVLSIAVATENSLEKDQ
jgi:hypothetical protein